jgi:futalosine hydrolase
VIAATTFELDGLDANTLVCGIGPVEAAAATARALAEERPDAVLHVGIAGARGIEPPAIVLGSEAVYCDIAGDAAAQLPRIHRVAADASLLAAAQVVLPDALVRPIGTTARVGYGHGYDVEAMEGFAVLRAAELAGVPALELRAISNHPDESDRSLWRSADAFAALADVVPRVLAVL